MKQVNDKFKVLCTYIQVIDSLMVNYCNVCILQIQCPQQTVTSGTRELGMTEKESLQTFCLQAGCKSSTKTSRFPDCNHGAHGLDMNKLFLMGRC